MNGRPGEAGTATQPTVALVAEKLVGGGRAIAHHEGATWMVAGALPGEHVLAVPVARRAGIVEARTVEVLAETHLARVPSPCPQSDLCGGCDWPHVDPLQGANLKASAAAEAARSFPDLANRVASAPIHRSENGYRLRARLHWDGERKLLGFYESRSRRVVSIAPCRILSPRFMQTRAELESALAETGAGTVDVEWLEGSGSGGAVAALRPAKGGAKRIDPAWVPGSEHLGSVISGFHRLGARGRLHAVWGSTEVGIDLPIALTVPIGAFFQTNRHLILPLFERVADLVGGYPAPVFDLHAGVGFLAAAAHHAGARSLTLIEPHRASALAARRNLPGAKVVVGSTAEAFIAGARDLPRDSIVMTDPPRSGLSRELRHRLASWLPGRILMLGCDPATWARDAGFLVQSGYRPQTVEIFDLFPSTHHLEIVALLERA